MKKMIPCLALAALFSISSQANAGTVTKTFVSGNWAKPIACRGADAQIGAYKNKHQMTSYKVTGTALKYKFGRRLWECRRTVAFQSPFVKIRKTIGFPAPVFSEQWARLQTTRKAEAFQLSQPGIKSFRQLSARCQYTKRGYRRGYVCTGVFEFTKKSGDKHVYGKVHSNGWSNPKCVNAAKWKLDSLKKKHKCKTFKVVKTTYKKKPNKTTDCALSIVCGL